MYAKIIDFLASLFGRDFFGRLRQMFSSTPPPATSTDAQPNKVQDVLMAIRVRLLKMDSTLWYLLLPIGFTVGSGGVAWYLFEQSNTYMLWDKPLVMVFLLLGFTAWLVAILVVLNLMQPIFSRLLDMQHEVLSARLDAEKAVRTAMQPPAIKPPSEVSISELATLMDKAKAQTVTDGTKTTVTEVPSALIAEATAILHNKSKP